MKFNPFLHFTKEAKADAPDGLVERENTWKERLIATYRLFAGTSIWVTKPNTKAPNTKANYIWGVFDYLFLTWPLNMLGEYLHSKGCKIYANPFLYLIIISMALNSLTSLILTPVVFLVATVPIGLGVDLVDFIKEKIKSKEKGETTPQQSSDPTSKSQPSESTADALKKIREEEKIKIREEARRNGGVVWVHHKSTFTSTGTNNNPPQQTSDPASISQPGSPNSSTGGSPSSQRQTKK
jgi:hypothetical protein